VVTGMALIDAIREERAEPPSGIRTLGLDGTHRWLRSVQPGHVALDWPVDDAYLNLEGAVICSWIAALGDQALFFAASTVCGDGEGTRMAEFGVRLLENITAGSVAIEARVVRRVGDRLFGECSFAVGADLKALMTATIEVVPA
jgi:acyl-coenzyme A thioesterase PaaI-like protein